MSDEFPGFAEDPSGTKPAATPPAKPAASAPSTPPSADEPLFKEDLEPAKPKVKAAPLPPVVAAAPFNPFAGVDVGAETTTLPPGVQPTPASSPAASRVSPGNGSGGRGDASRGSGSRADGSRADSSRADGSTISRSGTGLHQKPGTGAFTKPTTGRIERPGAQSLDDADDPELKPGSRKDLWICKHCGTGNKPDRNSCRSCAKRESDPLVVPWYRQPTTLIGVGGAALVIVVLGFLLRSKDAQYISVLNYDHIDGRIRMGKSISKEVVELPSGRKFLPKCQAAVMGRVVATQTFEEQGGIMVLLVLGGLAKDETRCDALPAQVKWDDLAAPLPGYQYGRDFEVLRLIGYDGSVPKPEIGKLLSLEGDLGDLETPEGEKITDLRGAKDRFMRLRRFSPP